MKEIVVSMAGTGGKQEFRNVRLMPGTRARDVLSQLSLSEFQLMKPEGGAFGFNDDIYAAVADKLKLYAAKADVEAGA
jgi:hypothetical protein